MAKIVSLALPEFAWLSGGEHESGGDPLDGRSVIYHIRSASVIEVFPIGNYVPASDTIKTFKFTHSNIFGVEEHYIAALHHCVVTDDADAIDRILRKAARWFCTYLDWEDGNIATDELSKMN